MTFDLRNPRLRRRLIIPAVGVILATVLYFLPTGYFVVSPGITRDVSGMISVGQGRGPGPGRFLMTTVATREANAWYFLYGALDPSSELRPESDFIPQGKSLEEYIKETEKMMRQSQDYARAAALRALGYPVEVKGDGARVVEVVPDSPAQDNLQPGDVIVAIDAQKVERVDDLMKAMSEIPIGASVDVRFLRSGQEQRLSLKTVENKTRPGKAMIGVRTETLNEGFVFPKEIKIDADHITGPSAGLMFALEIVRQLRKDVDITGGRVIAGTGTIDPTGKVGAIGGIAQKVITAERDGAVLFFAPRENFPQAARAAKRIQVVPVASLQEALDFLTRK